jgi:outer membrane protein assembly factor BamB
MARCCPRWRGGGFAGFGGCAAGRRSGVAVGICLAVGSCQATVLYKSGCNAGPVVSGDYLAMLYWETGLEVYQMNPTGATVVGSAELASDDNQSCTPAVKDGKVYGFVQKEGFCYDIQKKDFAWRVPVSGKSSSPILADGKVIQFCGNTFRIFDAATGKDQPPDKKAGKMDIAGHSSSAFVGGRLLVNSGSHLRCYDLAKR